MPEGSEITNLGATAVPVSESLAGVEAPRRGPTYGSRFAVASDHHLASQAAINIMVRGGNAADAAIAASAVNIVTKPHRSQLGGDVFAMVWRRQHDSVDCLQGAGLAPNAATLEHFRDGIPLRGAAASTIPGLVDSWVELNITYGTMPLARLLEPAIALAEAGFPVSQRLAGALTMLADRPESYSEALRAVFLKQGRLPYAAGEALRQPDLAVTLRRIGEEGREGFYEGPTATMVVSAMAGAAGVIGEADLAEQTAHWYEPIKTSYRGIDVHEHPMPSQGIVLLEALNIVERFPLREWGLESADSVHVMVEAAKLAFADSRAYGADPNLASVPQEKLLSEDLAAERAALIDLNQAQDPGPTLLPGDTTEFVVGDEDLCVAFIQSIFSPWGSGFLIPGTGILMNNRLGAFSLNPDHPNSLQPGKRTMHTLNLFMAIREGQLLIGGGTPGGDYQVQANLQTLVAALDWQLELQAAIDAPRWASLGGGNLTMESRFSAELLEDMARRGHQVQATAAWDGNLARSQVISSLPLGGLAVASDLRGEGVALAV